ATGPRLARLPFPPTDPGSELMPIVECVPNFSEGRDRAVIDRITAAIAGVDGVGLLDVDPGAATNRTVVTLVGEPDAVVEGAFQGIRAAAALIDMRRHSGAHARLGATDVCPFVPVSGITMEECAELARRLGKRVGEGLGIPVYLYEHAASRPERQNLADVRAGEYEGLAAKLADPEWQPDFGPAEFNASSGATVIGARKFLIAYNVNLNTRSRKLAHDIALDVREAGRLARDDAGKVIRDSDGKKLRRAGRLPATKAVGWYIDEYQRAQVSINLVDFDVTPPHLAFDVIEEEAQKRGLRVTGSELVGLIPLEAMLRAGRHYLERQGQSTGLPDRQIVEIAIQSLGLREISEFDPDEKIIEYRLAAAAASLVSRTVSGFADELSSDSPAPGGGSVAALSGALSAALSAMIGNLTHGLKGHEEAREAMSRLAAAAQGRKGWYLAAVDRDTEAFNRVIAAMRTKSRTAEEKAAKAERVRAANLGATQVPLEVLAGCAELIGLAAEAATSGNPNSLSDAGVAVWCARACAEGAYYNVLINLPGIAEDEAATAEISSKAAALIAEVRAAGDELAATIEQRLRE
ncbi:MAG: glutamate formimidoyltransferase, partial [Thermoanaerobaculia bacterium]